MIPATIIHDEHGNISILHPNCFTLKVSAVRRSIQANVRGRRLEVHVGMDQQLWYFNTYKEATDFDETPGQNIIAVTAEDCIKWIRSYTPRGPDQESLLEYYAHFHFPTWWKKREEERAREYALWEEDQKISAQIWYAREEARMNAEAESLVEKFPVEIEADELDLNQLLSDNLSKHKGE